MSLAIVFDISEKMDDFIRHGVTTHEIIFEYYINFVFHYSNLFSSMIIFISVILFTSKLARNNEITAILCSGVSYYRLLLPYFVAAGLLAGLSIYMNHNVLPYANQSRVEFENKYVHHRKVFSNVYREPQIGTVVYFDNNANNFFDRFLIRNWDGIELKKTVFAYRAYCDTLKNIWTLENYQIREYREGKDKIRTGNKLDTTFNFTAQSLGKTLNYASTMPSHDLRKYISEEKEKGNSEIALFEIELHQRTAYPIAAFILTLIAVSVAGRKSRGGTGLNLMIGFMVALFYIFSMKITTVAATNVGFNSLIAVWLPNFIFFFIALLFYRYAQK